MPGSFATVELLLSDHTLVTGMLLAVALCLAVAAFSARGNQLNKEGVMHTTLPSFDPATLEKGLALIQGMTITAVAARRNTLLSKQNREFYRQQEEALNEVIRFVRFHQTDRGVGC